MEHVLVLYLEQGRSNRRLRAVPEISNGKERAFAHSVEHTRSGLPKPADLTEALLDAFALRGLACSSQFPSEDAGNVGNVYEVLTRVILSEIR